MRNSNLRVLITESFTARFASQEVARSDVRRSVDQSIRCREERVSVQGVADLIVVNYIQLRQCTQLAFRGSEGRPSAPSSGTAMLVWPLLQRACGCHTFNQ